MRTAWLERDVPQLTALLATHDRDDAPGWAREQIQGYVALSKVAAFEVAVRSELADTVIQAITSKAKSGQIGDGKIFVVPLEHVVRIRTGETDGEAL